MANRYYDEFGEVRHHALNTEYRQPSPGSGYGTDEDRSSGSSSGEEGTWRDQGRQSPAAGPRAPTWLDIVTRYPDATYGNFFMRLMTMAEDPVDDNRAGLSIFDDVTELVMRERICEALEGSLPEEIPDEEWEAADEEEKQTLKEEWDAGLARVRDFARFAVRIRVYQRQSWPQGEDQISFTCQYMPADSTNEFIGAMFEFMMYEAMLPPAGDPTPLLVHMAGLMGWTQGLKLYMTRLAMKGIVTDHVIPGRARMSQAADGPAEYDARLLTGLASVTTKMIEAQLLDNPLSCVVVLRAGIEDAYGSTNAPIFDAVVEILTNCSTFLRKHLVTGQFAWTALSAADKQLYCLGTYRVLGNVDMGVDGGLHERRWDAWKAKVQIWSTDFPDERYGAIFQAMHRAEHAHPPVRRQGVPQTEQHSSSSSRGHRSSRSSRRH
ncbi:hypothetical protein LQW54_007210 [Pestalotiopsis sp. IQ-011]